MENTNKLYEIKCPHRVIHKGDKRVCNGLCGKVTASSEGEFWCRRCKKTFKFTFSKVLRINDDKKVVYYDYDVTSTITR